jgi:AcrR family transcriptional regulator
MLREMAKSTSGRRPRPKRDEVRRKLLMAAAEILERRGLDQTSLEDIADAAGFSKGAVYSNFESKDDLLLALIRQRVDERIAAVERARARAQGVDGAPHPARAGRGSFLAQSQALLRQLRATSRSLARFLTEDPAWHRLFLDFWLRATRNPQLREEFAVQRRAMRQLIARQAEAMAADLGLRLPVKSTVLATIVLALSNGVAIEHLADPAAVPADTLRTALDLLWLGLEEKVKRGR